MESFTRAASTTRWIPSSKFPTCCFLRLLTEKDETLRQIDKTYSPLFSGSWARFAWGNFVTLTGDQLFNAVRDAIEKLPRVSRSNRYRKASFQPRDLKIYDRPTLRAVVQEIDKLDLSAHDGHDVKGDMYEYLLSKLSVGYERPVPHTATYH